MGVLGLEQLTGHCAYQICWIEFESTMDLFPDTDGESIKTCRILLMMNRSSIAFRILSDIVRQAPRCALFRGRFSSARRTAWQSQRPNSLPTLLDTRMMLEGTIVARNTVVGLTSCIVGRRARAIACCLLATCLFAQDWNLDDCLKCIHTQPKKFRGRTGLTADACKAGMENNKWVP